MDFVVTSNGTLKMSWLKKIANYEDSNPVQLIFEGVERNETGEATGTAMETVLRSLRFGERYRVRLQDRKTNETVGSIEIEACKCFC